MLKMLTAYGISKQIDDANVRKNKQTKQRVVSPCRETDLFETVTGVLQGDTLASYLFVVVLDYARRETIEGKEEELGRAFELAIKLKLILNLQTILLFCLTKSTILRNYC